MPPQNRGVSQGHGYGARMTVLEFLDDLAIVTRQLAWAAPHRWCQGRRKIILIMCTEFKLVQFQVIKIRFLTENPLFARAPSPDHSH